MPRPLVAAVLATTFATLAPAQAAPTRPARPQGEPAAGADLQQELSALRKELRELRRMLDQLRSEQRTDEPGALRMRSLAPTTEIRKTEKAEKAEKTEKAVKTEPKVRTRTFTFSSDNDGQWV